MPKPVTLKKGQAFEFKNRGGFASKYSWDDWFKSDPKTGKGQLLQLVKGSDEQVTKKEADYSVETDAMPAKIKTAARKRYKVVRVSTRDADGAKLTDGIIIQARDMTAEERTAEDLKRAEEKAAGEETEEAPGTPAEAPATEAA